MAIRYKIRYDKKFYKDLYFIELTTTDNYYRNLKNKINIMIENLQLMPRTYKTLISTKDIDGEYRRMILGKYSIIYKIIKDEIIILRIFNQRENYLNSKSFILKEESQRYLVNRKGKFDMTKFRTLKNSYMKLKENFTRIITGEEVWSRSMDRLIEEAEESLKTEGYITLKEWREHMRRDYNIAL